MRLDLARSNLIPFANSTPFANLFIRFDILKVNLPLYLALMTGREACTTSAARSTATTAAEGIVVASEVTPRR